MSANQSKTAFREPSGLWCLYQCFVKGINPKRLQIPDADLHNKWVIITGGNSGIGREAALQFSKWGADVILGCRQPPPHEPHPDAVVEECKAAALAAGHKNTTVEWWECDMSNLASVEAFGKRWLAKDFPLDILANNAGIPGSVRGTVKRTVDGFEVLHQVNFLAHVSLTMVLLPSIRQAPSPRIICTTSCMQYIGKFDLNNVNDGGKKAYPSNKLYFQTWLTELRYRLSNHAESKHITVMGIHPGYVKTNIWHPSHTNNTRSVGERFLNLLTEYLAIDPQQGSLAITNAATAKDCSVEARSSAIIGKEMYRNRIWAWEPMPQTTNPECRRQIWEYVNKELKFEEKGLKQGFDM